MKKTLNYIPLFLLSSLPLFPAAPPLIPNSPPCSQILLHTLPSALHLHSSTLLKFSNYPRLPFKLQLEISLLQEKIHTISLQINSLSSQCNSSYNPIEIDKLARLVETLSPEITSLQNELDAYHLSILASELALDY